MGQYQQWLLCQEIDRRLRAELEALEIELAELQRKNAHLLEQQFPPANNIILRALSAGLNEPISPVNSSSEYIEYSNISPASPTAADQQGFSGESQSGALQFGNADLNTDNPGHQHLQPEMELLPHDMMAFLDEHSQTEPQLELPWWLRNMTTSPEQAANASSTHPIDQESIRTNWSVERWRERWRRPSTTSPTSPQSPSEKANE